MYPYTTLQQERPHRPWLRLLWRAPQPRAHPLRPRPWLSLLGSRETIHLCGRVLCHARHLKRCLYLVLLPPIRARHPTVAGCLFPPSNPSRDLWEAPVHPMRPQAQQPTAVLVWHPCSSLRRTVAALQSGDETTQVLFYQHPPTRRKRQMKKETVNMQGLPQGPARPFPYRNRQLGRLLEWLLLLRSRRGGERWLLGRRAVEPPVLPTHSNACATGSPTRLWVHSFPFQRHPLKLVSRTLITAQRLHLVQFIPSRARKRRRKRRRTRRARRPATSPLRPRAVPLGLLHHPLHHWPLHHGRHQQCQQRTRPQVPRRGLSHRCTRASCHRSIGSPPVKPRASHTLFLGRGHPRCGSGRCTSHTKRAVCLWAVCLRSILPVWGQVRRTQGKRDLCCSLDRCHSCDRPHLSLVRDRWQGLEQGLGLEAELGLEKRPEGYRPSRRPHQGSIHLQHSRSTSPGWIGWTNMSVSSARVCWCNSASAHHRAPGQKHLDMIRHLLSPRLRSSSDLRRADPPLRLCLPLGRRPLQD